MEQRVENPRRTDEVLSGWHSQGGAYIADPRVSAIVRAAYVASRVRPHRLALAGGPTAAFLEYGGGLLANYDFSDAPSAEKLNAAVTANRMCVIADEDEGKDETKHNPWRERAEASKGALVYMTTSGREIENDLSPQLVRKIVAERLGLPEPRRTSNPRPARRVNIWAASSRLRFQSIRPARP